MAPVRRIPRKERVLTALQNAGPTGCSKLDLADPRIGGGNFRQRIAELEGEGYRFFKKRRRDGMPMWVLTWEPGPAVEPDPQEHLFDPPPAPPVGAYAADEA